MKNIFWGILALLLVPLWGSAQNNQTSQNRSGKAKSPVTSRVPYVQKKQNAAMDESPADAQARRELVKKEDSEIRALEESIRQTRQRQQAELRVAEEQAKALRKKHREELDNLLKQEKAIHDKYRAEKTALAKKNSVKQPQNEKTTSTGEKYVPEKKKPAR